MPHLPIYPAILLALLALPGCASVSIPLPEPAPTFVREGIPEIDRLPIADHAKFTATERRAGVSVVMSKNTLRFFDYLTSCRNVVMAQSPQSLSDLQSFFHWSMETMNPPEMIMSNLAMTLGTSFAHVSAARDLPEALAQRKDGGVIMIMDISPGKSVRCTEIPSLAVFELNQQVAALTPSLERICTVGHAGDYKAAKKAGHFQQSMGHDNLMKLQASFLRWSFREFNHRFEEACLQ